jgi:hypothetical protein
MRFWQLTCFSSSIETDASRPFLAWCHSLYYDEAHSRESTWDIRTMQRLNPSLLTISTHTTTLEQSTNIPVARRT